MFIVTFGIAFGGLIACGIVALALIYFVGIENKITQICLYILIIPALILFLLGLGLGDNAFRKACARLSETDESSPDRGVERLDPKDDYRCEQADAGKPDNAAS